MRQIVISAQYKKDLKLARKRELPEEELNQVIFDLASDIPLSPDKKDHALKGNLARYRECHIQPNLVTDLHKENEGELHILNLVRTGTHSDLYKK